MIKKYTKMTKNTQKLKFTKQLIKEMMMIKKDKKLCRGHPS